MTLELEQAIEHAEAIVAERGADFVYNPGGNGICTYVPRSDPRCPVSKIIGDRKVAKGADICGCLVGEIITRAGLMTDVIASYRGGVRSLVSEEGLLDVSDTAETFLYDLQRTQDRGANWGDALESVRFLHSKGGTYLGNA